MKISLKQHWTFIHVKQLYSYCLESVLTNGDHMLNEEYQKNINLSLVNMALI